MRVTPRTGGGGGQQRIQAYPNPAQEVLTIADILVYEAETIELAEDTDFTVALFDSDNKKVKQGQSTNGKMELDIRDLPNGYYYLQIEKIQELITSRIQIKR